MSDTHSLSSYACCTLPDAVIHPLLYLFIRDKSYINYPEVFLKKMNIGEVLTYFTRHSTFHVKCNDFPCKINDCNKFHFKAGPSWVTPLVKSASR